MQVFRRTERMLQKQAEEMTNFILISTSSKMLKQVIKNVAILWIENKKCHDMDS